MRCGCVLVKPHHFSEITSSTEWADFWRFGCDKDQFLFQGFWGHCSMEVLQKQPLDVPFACCPNPVAQLIRCGARHILPACASVRGAAQGGEPRGTWGCGNLLESCWGREWTIMAGWVQVKWPHKLSHLGFLFPWYWFTNSMITGLIFPFWCTSNKNQGRKTETLKSYVIWAIRYDRAQIIGH